MSYLDDEIALEKIREEVRQGKDPRYSRDSDISRYYLRLKDRESARIFEEIEADQNKRYQNQKQEADRANRQKTEDLAEADRMIHAQIRRQEDADRYYNQPEIRGTEKWETEYARPKIIDTLSYVQQDTSQLQDDLRDYYFKHKLSIDQKVSENINAVESYKLSEKKKEDEAEAYLLEYKAKKEKQREEGNFTSLVLVIVWNLFVLFLAMTLPIPFGIILWLVLGLPAIFTVLQDWNQ